jgi:hypothetical protein
VEPEAGLLVLLSPGRRAFKTALGAILKAAAKGESTPGEGQAFVAMLEAYRKGGLLKLNSGNGCQPRSGAFLKLTATLDIELILASSHNPKGNAETERCRRPLKEKLFWLEGFASLDVAQDQLLAGHYTGALKLLTSSG